MGQPKYLHRFFEKGMSYSIIRPADPQKDGYVFLGWYADADYNTLFDFNVPVTGNTTVYARFIDLSAENERIILDGGTTTLPSAINLDVTLKGTAQLILTGEVPMMNSKSACSVLMYAFICRVASRQ